MSKTSKTNFVEYLDSYKERNGLDYFTLANMLHLTNMNYIENQYYSESFIGANAFRSTKDDYETWKRKHEATFTPAADDFICLKLQNPIPLNDIPKPPTPIPTKYQEIDASLNHLGDVLEVLQKYPYCPDTEYNIDIKSLSAVETELKQLNTMVGMTSLKTAILDQLVYFLQDLHITRGESDFKHIVLYGPPGTGKQRLLKSSAPCIRKLVSSRKTFSKKSRAMIWWQVI